MSVTSTQVGHLFCFGLGYTASRLAARLAARGWAISGTSRSIEQAAVGHALGYAMHIFDGTARTEAACLDDVSHILISVPPGRDPGSAGDPVLAQFAAAFADLPTLSWLGYLSTTGVFGNTDGAWVDEDAPLKPNVARSVRCAAAEAAWGRWGLSARFEWRVPGGPAGRWPWWPRPRAAPTWRCWRAGTGRRARRGC